MKKALSFFAVLWCLASTQVWAYDFSAVAPNGQTLYYNIVSGHAEVVYPGNDNYVTGNLIIPTTVTYAGITFTVNAIGDNAFKFCGLTSVTIPNSVTSIGNNAFWYCSGLTGALTIPNSVTSIGYGAFAHCSGLTSVTIGNSVTSIGYEAFYGCSGLTSVAIPNSVTSIGLEAFSGCSGLTSVTIGNSMTSIGNYAFRDCSSLTSVTIPSSVTSIGYGAFLGCSSLTSVTIPNSVTSIGSGAFYGCSGLTSVTIPNSVTSIGSSAFYGCSGLTSVTIPNSVTSIGSSAFSGCSGLTSVTIGSGVTDIAGGAFYNCTGLTEIHSLRPVAPQLGTYNGHGAFDGVPSSIPVRIPCGSSTSYYSRWSYFSNFVEEEGFTFTATSANEQQGTVQILTMPTCTSPHAVVYATANSGYHFDHWSDGSTSNPYSLTVTDDLDLIGYFVSDSGTEGIEEVGSQRSEGRVYAVEGKIVVEGGVVTIRSCPSSICSAAPSTI